MKIKFKNKLVLVAFILSCFTSCKKVKELDAVEFTNFVNSTKSGLVKDKILNGVKYTLKCQIPEVQCLIFNKNKIKTQKDFEDALKDYTGKLNFILLIEDASDEKKVKQIVYNKEKYGSLLEYANSNLQNDFTLDTKMDILPCALVHLESANSLHPIFRIAVSFSGINKNEEVTLVFNDQILGNGPIKFNYPENTFKELPDLKINAL